MMPPLITVGSKPPASSSAATSEVVVVLPWVPPIATQLLSRISSASISARRTTGRRLRARRDELGIVALDRGRDHDHLGVAEVAGGMADRNLGALVAQALDVGAVGRVRALHGVAEIDQHLGDAAHADAADADEMDRTDVARQFHRAVSFRIVCNHEIGEPLGGVERALRAGGRGHCYELLRRAGKRS